MSSRKLVVPPSVLGSYRRLLAIIEVLIVSRSYYNKSNRPIGEALEEGPRICRIYVVYERTNPILRP